MSLNLDGVTYVDSSGIGELVSRHTTTKNQDGQQITSLARAPTAAVKIAVGTSRFLGAYNTIERQIRRPSAMRHTALLDDAFTDCYQSVSHIIERYGQPSTRDGSRAFCAGDLLLIRTADRTVVKFKGQEVMCVPAMLGPESVRWHPRKCWVDEIDRIYESIEPEL